MSFFSFIAPEHPFHAELERLRDVLRHEPRHEAGADAKTAVHAEIKGVWTPEQGWTLDRFYWSFQRWSGAVPCLPFGALPFGASTLFFMPREGRTQFYEFPHDPYLKAMGPYFEQALADGDRGRRFDVLRYVPLRRLTFKIVDADGSAVIGKFKRKSKLRESYERLGAIAQAVAQCAPGFAAAAPRGLDEGRSMFFQEAMAGCNLADLLDESNCIDLLHRVGALHRALHRLPIAGEAGAAPQDPLPALRRELAWVAFLQPAYAQVLDQVWQGLAACPPEPQAPACCHGDFVCSQILVDSERWSITDFDLSRPGDPYPEIAKLIASLKYDVPLFQARYAQGGADEILDRAIAAYLHGYQRDAVAGTRLDPRCLLWHRARAEINYLSLMLTKDWLVPAVFERSLRSVRDIVREIRR